MCGLTGFYAIKTNKKRSELHAQGRIMADSIRNRGPDGSDVWQDPDMPVLLAHRRLAILDLSAEGAQPMHSVSSRFTTVYNGEIYNYLDIKRDLEAAGISFRGRSDTEVILAATERWGINQTIQRLNGMFALVVWDRQTRQLHFARDRLGKKPLYIGWAGDTLVFASELKAIRAHADFVPAVDTQSLGLYLRYGYIPAPSTIYKNVWSLPAGFRLTLSADNLQAGTNLQNLIEPYWHHLRVLEQARAIPHARTDIETIREFEALLTDCVQSRMISDVPLGAFLSGGIDSSTIVALMQKISSSPVKTYSIGFKEFGFDEAASAKKIAEHLGTDHHEMYVSGKDAVAQVPLLSEIYDEPFADISALPTLIVSRFARQDVTVALSGDGGDEMLGGYNRHLQAARLGASIRRIPRPLRRMAASAIECISPETWDKMLRRRPQFGSGLHKAASILSMDSEEDIYERLLSQWNVSPMLTPKAASTLRDNPEWQLNGTGLHLSFPEKMMYWDALFYLPNDVLVKVDRASMAASLEARAPLLDYRIYDFCWQLSLSSKIRNGQGKWLLRQVLKRHVPEKLFERPKQGFNMPVGDWLRGPLKDWADNLLSEKTMKQQNYLDTRVVRNTWNEHLNGRGNHAGKLWTILMFQAWHERWL